MAQYQDERLYTMLHQNSQQILQVKEKSLNTKIGFPTLIIWRLSLITVPKIDCKRSYQATISNAQNIIKVENLENQENHRNRKEKKDGKSDPFFTPPHTSNWAGYR